MKKTSLLISILLIGFCYQVYSQVPAYVPTSGLVAWYPFSGNAGDSSGHGYNGIVTGATLTTDRFGNSNSAYSFNGSTDHIALGTSTPDSFTISCWINVSSIISWCCNGGNLGEAFLSTTSCDISGCSGYELQLNWNNPTYTSHAVFSCFGSPYDTLNLNAWVHICTTYKNDTSQVYINGVLFSKFYDPTVFNSYNINVGSRYQTTCGSCGIWAAPYFWFHGKMDDIGVWSRPLSACEILRLYRSSLSTTPSVGIISGLSSLCNGTTITLTDTVSGGTWSSSNTAIATIGSAGLVNGISAGTAIISYTLNNACSSASATKIITVNTLPIAGTILGSSTVCTGSSTTLTNATPGGLWSSTNSRASVSGGGIVTGITGGIDTIMYIVINSCGVATASKTMTVNISPYASSITGASSVCVGSSITLTDTASGGVWSSSNTAIAIVGSTGIVSGIAGGGATISYSVTNTCGTAFAIRSITVNPLPQAGSITGMSAVCVGSSISLSDTASGGVWSATNSNAIVTSGGVVYGLVAGTDTIIYSVTNTCGTATTTKTITINPLPNAGTITGSITVCEGLVTTLTNTATGGVWSSSDTTIATIGSSGIVSGMTAGNSTITYTVTTLCGSATTTINLTVNPLPNAGTISGIDSVCPEQNVALTATATGGIWSSSDTTIATISSSGIVTGIMFGTTILSYSVTNSCGTAIATFGVSVKQNGDCNTLVGDIRVASEISVFPNPSNGEFSIKGTIGNGNDIVYITVTDMLGRMVYEENTTTKSGRLDKKMKLSDHVKSGTYILNLISPTESKVFHVIIEK